MKCFPSFLVATILAAALTAACVPALTSPKQSQVPGQAAGQKKAADAPKQAASAKAPGAGSKDATPAEVPLLPLPGVDKSGSSNELNSRQEVNQAALEFTANQNIPNVRGVKTCYSKLDGGWSLYIYVAKGKKAAYHQFLWNPKGKEWEPIPAMDQKEIPADQLKYYFESQVNNETCSVLKNLTEK